MEKKSSFLKKDIKKSKWSGGIHTVDYNAKKKKKTAAL